ncbi:hypothetical protein [uncultured Devosia sp.]|uniref:hypothetical protein n=1 Tax=uncultured Devosia sp. TaxID=211434 RepID=UPI0035CC069B
MEPSGPFLWLIALVGGLIVLGLAMAYGMSRNSTRTPGEKQVTEDATRARYDADDKDHS